ncbi:MAG: hypothetical protein GY888_02315 [Planctomycetaceae bacterium]|nr:hypothetical protein [Planctomycetaceae bacterium]
MRDFSRNVCSTEFQFAGRYLAGQVVLVQAVLTALFVRNGVSLIFQGSDMFLQ